MTTKLQAVLVRLHATQWQRTATNKSKTKEITQQEHASEDSGVWRDKLIPKSAVNGENLLDALSGTVSKARSIVKSLGTPWESPWNLLPVKNEPACRTGLTDCQRDLEGLLLKLPDVWDGYIEQAKVKRSGLFNAADYPDVHKLVGKYTIIFDFSPVPTGDHFVQGLMSESLEKLRDEMDKRNAALLQASQANLIARLVEPLKEFAERLANPDERKFGKTLTMLGRVCDEVDNLNSTTSDASITGLVSVTRNLVTALTPDADALQDEAIAKSVKETTEKIVAQFGEPYVRKFV